MSNSNARRLRGSQAGMTLIEVLVATAIMAILMATCYGIYTGVRTGQDRLDARGRLLHQARVLTHRLGLELRSLTTTTRGTDLRVSPDPYGRPTLELTTRAAAVPENRGTVLVRYQLAPPGPEETALVLQRGERPAFLPQDTVELRPMLPSVRSLAWEVFDGTDWQSQWTGGQPRAVRLQLTLAQDGETLTISTAWELPL